MALEELNEVSQFLNAKEFLENPYQREMKLSTVIEQKISQEIPRTNLSDYLVAFSTQNHSYCVGCVDMVGSTKISASLSPNRLSFYYEIFLNSMSKIIGKFGGRVIKNVGDCLLYYFPNTKDNTNSEELNNCLDCGLVMLEAQQVISQELSQKSLPRLHYRVSADYGSVMIMNTTDSQKIDLIGPPVNMCTKINRCAKKDEYVIGADLHLIAKKLQKYKFIQTKSYDVGFPQSYPVYQVIPR